MKKLFAFLIAIPLLIFADDGEIAIHNRPLVKVNGKTISIIDVMKKMNAFIYTNYPHAVGNKPMLYQFYAGNWRSTLDDMINNELMLMEAETKEVKVSDGDVREEVEARFGPNIMANLDKIDLTLDEARQLIHTELVTQRIMWMNVNQKALNEVTPQKVKEGYALYLQQNPTTDKWVYRVLSIRGKDKDLCEKLAKAAAAMVSSKKSDLATAAAEIKGEASDLKINLSEEFDLKAAELSEQHKSILSKLDVDSYSEPVAQTSRADGSTVWRIFHLKDREEIKPLDFEMICERIKSQLLQERFSHYSKQYFEKLRKQYNLTQEQIDQMVPSDVTPFVYK